MKPVLLEVDRSCGSAWIAVDGSRRAVVKGLTGESYVRMEFGGRTEPLLLHHNGEHELPEGVSMLKASAVVLEEDTLVTLDLV